MFKMTQCKDSYLRFGWNLRLFLLFYIPLLISAFSPQSTQFASVRRQTVHDFSHQSLSALSGSTTTKSDDPCTIQILMSDTGGGHRASANALRDALDVLYPGKFECDIVDIYTDYGPFWPFNGVVAGYKLMAKYSILWDFFYHSGETEFGLWLNELLLDVFCHEPFKKCLARPSGSTDKRADMVVSVHPLCQNPTLKILADLDTNGETRDRMKRKTPFVTVVTDLGGASKTWFNPFVDKCFVPSIVLNEKAKSMGLSATQIVQYGLPIRKGFWSSSSNSSAKEKKKPLFDFFRGNNSPPTGKSSMRSELGLDGDLPTVLVVGGGDGMGGIVDIANTMGEKLGANSPAPSCQMVVVCGSNKDAKDKLSSKSWGPGVRVVVQGFVNNMDEWMNASDAIVTKAGPGTIAEASICGLPCMLFAYLPGQEEGNVPFVEDSGFGKYSSNPQVIANTVNSWLSSPETLQSLSAAALKAARPDATLDIARDIADIALATKTKNEKVLVRSR